MLHAFDYFNHYLRVNNKKFQWFKWFANAFVFTGATCIALSPVYSQQPWPFFLATIGSVLWLWAAHIMRDRALFVFNLFFIVIQTWATLVRLH